MIVAVLAYTLSPLTVLSRRALEANLPLMSGLRRRLRASELELAKKMNTQVRLAIRHLMRAERVTAEILRELPKKRAVGCGLQALTDDSSIAAALREIDAWSAARRSYKFVDIDDLEDKTKELVTLEDTAAALGVALARNSANLSSAESLTINSSANPDIARSDELQNAYMVFRAQCKDYVVTAREETAQYADKQYVRFPPSNIRATQFANIRYAAESYASRTYAVEFEYLWPRMQFVLAKDDKAGAMVDLAKTQVDYSVVLLSLATVFFVVWLPLLCFVGPSPWMFLLVGLAAPPVVQLLYELAIDSEHLFGSMLRATIDHYRLDVLASLSVPPPGSLAVERQRWIDLQTATSAEGLVDLPLRVAPK